MSEHERLALVMAALGHVARIELLYVLASREPMTTTQLAITIAQDRDEVRDHVRGLLDGGLVMRVGTRDAIAWRITIAGRQIEALVRDFAEESQGVRTRRRA